MGEMCRQRAGEGAIVPPSWRLDQVEWNEHRWRKSRIWPEWQRLPTRQGVRRWPQDLHADGRWPLLTVSDPVVDDVGTGSADTVEQHAGGGSDRVAAEKQSVGAVRNL